MDSSKELNLVVCSAMVAPARRLVFYKLRTWLDQVVRIVVHTFAVEESKLPLNPEEPSGYWFCAGDFCDIDEAGVYQHLSNADLGFAKCLVSPDIKDNHPEREILVISGEYGVHYVCHNITNRILYATDKCETLIDLDIKTTGYEVVVKSVLGIYGQNRVEWENRKQRCAGESASNNPACKNIDLKNRPNRTRDEEIHRIHLRAARGNTAKAENITHALNETDNNFYASTGQLFEQYDAKIIDLDGYNLGMVNACSLLFSETIRIVGRSVAIEIYPECNIDLTAIKVEPEVEGIVVEDKFIAM